MVLSLPLLLYLQHFSYQRKQRQNQFLPIATSQMKVCYSAEKDLNVFY